MSKELSEGSRFYVPVWNGLLTAEHRQAMGSAVWTYMLLVDWTPKKSKDGAVRDGALIQINDIVEQAGYSYPQVQRDLEKLNGTYIKIKRSARGFKIKILKWRPIELSKSKVDNSSIFQEAHKSSAEAELSISKVDKLSSCDIDNSPTNLDNSLSKVDNSIEQDILELKKYICEIFKIWNQQEIIVHSELDETAKKAAKKALKEFTFDQILEAIRNYGTVVNSSDHFFNYRWRIEKFLTGGGPDRIPFNNLKQFLNESEPLENFKRNTGGAKPKLAEKSHMDGFIRAAEEAGAC